MNARYRKRIAPPQLQSILWREFLVKKIVNVAKLHRPTST